MNVADYMVKRLPILERKGIKRYGKRRAWLKAARVDYSTVWRWQNGKSRPTVAKFNRLESSVK